MDPRQTKIVLILIVVVGLCWLIAPLLASRGETAWDMPQGAPAFDAARTMATIREYVTRYPQRVLGSLEARESTGFFARHLEPLGYTITYSHFDTVIQSHRQVGRNVVAFRPGASPEIVAVIAHYDTAPTTIQGAMDNGSGVGVLLELATLFSTETPRRSILFVLSDGEEWGSLGAMDIAQNYPERNRIVAVLSLDHVAIGDLSAFLLDTVGQNAGYTPPWLRQMTRAITEREGLPGLYSCGFKEQVQRAMLISGSDQGPFLAQGIPAINLGSQSTDQAKAEAVYHSEADTVDNLKQESIARYGRAAERMIRTLAGLESIRRESMGAFCLNGSKFLSPALIHILQYMIFLPVAAILVFHWINRRKTVNLFRTVHELLAFFSTLLPFMALYGLIQLVRLLRLLPRYTLYPGTAKDPVLQSPAWGVLASIAGIALFLALCLWLLFRFVYPRTPRPDYFASKLILLNLLIALILIALQYNVYWAVTFLAVPAFVWSLVDVGRGPGDRTANRLWIVAAGIPFFAMVAWFAAKYGLGRNVVWYGALALSTGMFTLTGFVLAASAACLGVRFIVIQSLSRTEGN